MNKQLYLTFAAWCLFAVSAWAQFTVEGQVVDPQGTPLIGVNIIEQINDFQNSIAGAVEEQTVVTKEISKNVADAATGTSEIAENITAVARAAESTAEGASTTLEGAEKSTRLAGQLRDLVEQFKS